MKIFSRLFALVLCLAVQMPVHAASAMPVAPTLAARSWMLYDVTSEQVLAAEKPDERAEPASLTKLMTAYVVFDALKNKTITLEQQVPVSEKAWRMVKSGSAMFIEPRRPVTVDELIHGMIIQSGNDASVALAELVGGTEENFAAMMNRTAARLGLTGTHYKNATGLTEEGHYTTPRDLAKLASAIIHDFPQYFPIYSQKEYTYNKIKQPNRNRLLWADPSVDGMKTGHTDAAGYCLVSTAHRGQRRVISVVMGTVSESVRAQESMKLLNFGFAAYDTPRLYAANQPVRNVRVWQGKTNEVAAGFARDVFVAAPRDAAKDVKQEFVVNPQLVAPIAKGATVGTLKLSLGGQVLGSYPVVALQDVQQAGWFGRVWDSLRMKIGK
ncbi:D-alanyl-D-alanine carboxypeptidase family protein [Uliginosibacterium sp. sgz301328]|uniref:D-alanyl-D-alanine carboxypeptidase family protein n=1 Tax=Uliginosibacterium sp. sgz301328 TaxID=3243764 RepID=UPI00359E0E04